MSEARRRHDQRRQQGLPAGRRDLETQTRIDNPLLVEEDGAVYQMRRWYQQFYVDVADVTADMTDRFELEVDTTAANEKWHVEVEENLARQTAEAEQPAS